MRKILTTAAAIALFLLLLGQFGGLPGPYQVWSGLIELCDNGTLFHDISVSLARWAIGCSAGVVVGLTLGFATGRFRRLGSLLEGPLTFMRAVPFIALLPLSLRIFGISELGKIIVVAWAAAGISWLLLHRASQALPPELMWRARSIGCSKVEVFLKIQLPCLAQDILGALKASLTLGFIVVAVVELSGVYERSSGRWWSEGLGYRMFRSLEESRDDLMLASIFCFAAIGASVENAIALTWSAIYSLGLLSRKSKVRREIATVESSLQSISRSGQCYELEVYGLTAKYGTKLVFKDLSFTVPGGQTLCILGKSGSGKSTLLKAIGNFSDGILTFSGNVTLNGQHVAQPSQIGVVFQDAPVFAQLLVWENLRLVSPANHVKELLSEFGLFDVSASLASTLSGGQRQRLALATALSSQPHILLLDEPLGALDFMTRRSMQQFYFEQIRGNITTILVTHNVDEALLLGHSIMIGVGEDARIYKTDAGASTSFETWEESATFAELRKEILLRLVETN